MTSKSKRNRPVQPGRVSTVDSMVESISPAWVAHRSATEVKRSPQVPSPKLPATRGKSAKKTARKKVTTREQIEKVVDVLIDLLMCYGYEIGGKPHYIARQNTIDHWYRLSTSVGGIFSWMKVAKWKLAAFYFAHTRQIGTPPPPPEFRDGLTDQPHLLMCGILGKYSLLLARRPANESRQHRRERLSFLQSILLSKKGMPRPDQDMVDAQVRDTVSALTRLNGSLQPKAELEGLLEWGDEYEADNHGVSTEADFEDLKQACIATVDELFAGVTYSREKATRPYFPSTKSSFVDTMTQGGQFAAIRRLAEEIGLLDRTNVAFKTDFVDLPPEPRVYQNRARLWSQHWPYGDNAPSHEIKTDPEERVRYSVGGLRFGVNTTELDNNFGVLWYTALTRALRATHHVRPVGLAEALKVRVITKGDPYVGFVLKPVQKMMWQVLSSHPTFALVGKPVTAELIQNAMGAGLAHDQFYLSGDYSAATDNLNPVISEIIARRIADRVDLPAEETELLVAALTGHRFEARKQNGIDEERPQVWGQLMGSVVSFPILCIANAAVCRWALELDYKRPMALEECPLLINGDDCLLRCTQVGHDAWSRLSRAIGLTPSLGKYYCSREFANINSTCFERLSEDEPAEEEDNGLNFRLVRAVNLGLMYGMKRSSEEVTKADFAGVRETLGSRGRELMENCPKRFQKEVWKRFINHHWEKLSEARVPWYMPEEWGGLGLPPMLTDEALAYEKATRAGEDCVPPDAYFVGSYGPTKIDLQLAAVIRGAQDKYSFRKPSVTVDWATWKMASQALPAKPATITDDETVRRKFDKTVNSLVVATLFGRASPHQPGKSFKSSKALGANQKTWSKLQALKSRPTHGLSWMSVTADAPLPPVLEISTVKGKAFVNGDRYRYSKHLIAGDLRADLIGIQEQMNDWD